MAPPIFADLGKATRDIFSDKVYPLDIFKLIAKTNTCGNMTLKTEVVHKFKDGQFNGKVEGIYPYPMYGLTFTKRWNTDNVIGLAAELKDKLYPGITLKLDGTFAPDTGNKNGTTSITYKHENASALVSYSGGTGTEDNQKLDTSLVLGYQGWLAGGRVNYDNTERNITNYYAGLGHSYGSLQAFIFNQNNQLFTVNIYQRVNNRLEMGLSFGADMGEEKKKFYNLGARYLLNEDMSFRAKIDNSSKVGLGLETTIKGCVKLVLSCLIDGTKLEEGNHKFGMAVEIM